MGKPNDSPISPVQVFFGRVARVLAATCNVHIFLINSRALNSSAPAWELPTGHSVRYLEQADIGTLSQDGALNLSREFLEAALERGDLCIGYFDDDRLVSYFWCGFDAVPMEQGLWVRVPPGMSYAYKALTLSTHRGQHLQHKLTNASDRHLTQRGLTHNIEYIAADNFPQRIASARYGNRTIGLAGYLKWGKWLWPFHSRAVRTSGFAFYFPGA